MIQPTSSSLSAGISSTSFADVPGGRHVGREALAADAVHQIEQHLDAVATAGRTRMFEHEVYAILKAIGAVSVPRHVLIPRGQTISPEQLAQFPGRRVVLKIVSEAVVHKTEAHGIVFAEKKHAEVCAAIERLVAEHATRGAVEGVLVVEYVERPHPGFGNELFVGIRSTREFGPVIAAGLGGVDTEYLAHVMKPGLAVAKAAAADITGEQFFELFRQTAAYDLLSGMARGHDRIVSDSALLRCFEAFIVLAQRFCIDRGAAGPDLAELEVNPFSFRNFDMIALDGRGRLGKATPAPPPRPIDRIGCLLEPRSIAIVGVSATSMNYGRIMLSNIRESGFPVEHLYAIKQGHEDIDGVRCVPTIAELPETVDLLVLAVGSTQLPQVVGEAVDSGKVRTGIMIAGGVGETEGTEQIQAQVGERIARGRCRPDGGPVFVGPNCMGIQSRVGRYDTFFVPSEHMDFRRSAPARPCALISQSGAFVITRLDNLETLDPALAITIGNQIDLTLADMLTAVASRDDIHAIGVYAEGFNDLDGLAFVRAVRQASAAGKVVIFYKAGRTPPGRSAAAGHTAAVAGDYDVCQAAVAQAGAIVVDTFKEFEQLIELATALHTKRVGGRRIAAITNAGFEAVGIADSIRGVRYDVQMAELKPQTRQRLRDALAEHHMTGMVNARNPIDLTSMATEALYERCAEAMLACDNVDALVVSCVPMSPTIRTAPHEIDAPDTLAARLPRLFRAADKPLVAVVDAGPLYNALARAIRSAGVPMFRSADQAIRSLGRYLCHRGAQPDRRNE